MLCSLDILPRYTSPAVLTVNECSESSEWLVKELRTCWLPIDGVGVRPPLVDWMDDIDGNWMDPSPVGFLLT